MSVKITVVGTGYVGLVSGACFAELGHDVICVDTDAAKIAMIGQGKMPIYEPGLEEIVKNNVERGRLRFSTDTDASVKGRDAVVIAVGTPAEPLTGRADLRYVFAAAAQVAAGIDRFTVIVTKSTVPVGTNRRVQAAISAQLGGTEGFAVASNPEFLREGAAIRDFMEPDRVVVGCEDSRANEVMERLYAPLTSQHVPLLTTNMETAEMIKYAANAFLAVKVSFINEAADLCEAIGANVADVAKGIGLDKRIGAAFLKAGPGWGGSCLPKDTSALLATASDAGLPARILTAAIDANAERKGAMVERVLQAVGGDLKGKRIGVLGLTFKGQTDDMRDSPSLAILPSIIAAGATVVAFDPAHPPIEALLPGVRLAETPAEAAQDADLLLVLTEWMIFKSYDLRALRAAMRRPVMLDLRNLFDTRKVLAAGFERHIVLGRGEVVSAPAIAERRGAA